MISGTNALSTTVPALETWLYRGGSVAIETSQPASLGQAAVIQVGRPGLAITVTQPISANARLQTQVMPGYQLGAQTYSPAAVAAPAGGNESQVFRAQVALDYPAYTGMVRTWVETAAPGEEREMRQASGAKTCARR